MEREFEPGSCQTCTRRNCLVNNFLDTSEHFTNAEGDRRYNLRKGHLHCNSKFVVYKIRCKTCNKQYVGSTITKFRERFNNYKFQFRKYSRLKESGCQNPGKDISQARCFEHFLSNDHGGMDDWSFQIIDQADTRERLRVREAFWQYRLNSFIPHGLNEREVILWGLILVSFYGIFIGLQLFSTKFVSYSTSLATFTYLSVSTCFAFLNSLYDFVNSFVIVRYGKWF